MRKLIYCLLPLIVIFLVFFKFSASSADISSCINASSYEKTAFGERYVTECSLNDVFYALKAKTRFVERVGDTDIYYCRSPYGSKNLSLNGVRFNCQIAVKADKTTVGFPLIYT